MKRTGCVVCFNKCTCRDTEKSAFCPLLFFFLLACVYMQPAVCTRELCVFSFYTLGVMSGAAEEVATGAEVTSTQQIVLNVICNFLISLCQ